MGRWQATGYIPILLDYLTGYHGYRPILLMLFDWLPWIQTYITDTLIGYHGCRPILLTLFYWLTWIQTYITEIWLVTMATDLYYWHYVTGYHGYKPILLGLFDWLPWLHTYIPNFIHCTNGLVFIKFWVWSITLLLTYITENIVLAWYITVVTKVKNPYNYSICIVSYNRK